MAMVQVEMIVLWTNIVVLEIEKWNLKSILEIKVIGMNYM